jgi:SAM-dependent methyltransferase
LEQQAYREQFETEDAHWWFEGRRAVIWALLESAGLSTPGQGLRILDAGCGTGRNLIEFASLGDPRGIDSSPEAIDFCRRRGVGGATEGRLESLPFADGSFDLIFATDVLEHLEDDRRVMGELWRVAAPGARLLATVPAYQWLWSQHDEAHHHFRRYTLRGLRERLSAEGWEAVEWSYFNTVLLPPIAAVRTLARRRPPADGRPDLKLTPPTLNRMLLAPMKAEAAIIKRGARLPAGVSIGMVCRRADPLSAPRSALAAQASPATPRVAHPEAGARGAPR